MHGLRLLPIGLVMVVVACSGTSGPPPTPTPPSSYASIADALSALEIAPGESSLDIGRKLSLQRWVSLLDATQSWEESTLHTQLDDDTAALTQVARLIGGSSTTSPFRVRFGTLPLYYGSDAYSGWVDIDKVSASVEDRSGRISDVDRQNGSQAWIRTTLNFFERRATAYYQEPSSAQKKAARGADPIESDLPEPSEWVQRELVSDATLDDGTWSASLRFVQNTTWWPMIGQPYEATDLISMMMTAYDDCPSPQRVADGSSQGTGCYWQ